MAKDVKILSNVGVKRGYAGDGIIYAGKVAEGPYIFIVKHLEGGVETWRYYRVSMIQAGMQTEDVKLASDVNLALFTDVTEGDFIIAEGAPFNKITTVVNAGTLPRLYNYETAYSLKGENVTTADIAKVRSTSNVSAKLDGETGTTTTTTTGGLGGIIPTDFNALFSNPLKFAQDNAVFVGIVLAAIYYFRRKKKKPLWIF